MNRDEIINICEDVAQFETVGDESEAVFEATTLIKSLEEERDQLKAGLLEMAEAVILQAGQQDGCPECRAWADFNLPIVHKADCTVLKAEQIIKNNY